MARQTESERLVSKANLFYKRKGIALIHKVDSGMRVIQGRLFYSESRGLDYSGTLKDGTHVEFEVKQTMKTYLPMSSIRDSQVNRMSGLDKFKADSFLLVFFSEIKEWYRLESKKLVELAENGYTRIPLAYFRAFGYLVPSHNGYPDYLNPETHVDSNSLKCSYREWMPKPKIEAIYDSDNFPQRKINVLDAEERKRRIRAAIEQGIKNAEKKQQAVQVFKAMNRGRRHGPKR